MTSMNVINTSVEKFLQISGQMLTAVTLCDALWDNKNYKNKAGIASAETSGSHSWVLFIVFIKYMFYCQMLCAAVWLKYLLAWWDREHYMHYSWRA